MNNIISIDGTTLKWMFINAANTLDNKREIIDSLNVFPVPDGDTGTNMSLTMFLLSRSARLKGRGGRRCGSDCDGLLMGARGNSGVILSSSFAVSQPN